MSASDLYAQRFSEEERRRKAALWRILCQYFFQRYISPGDTVVDLGAGFCEFINQIQAADKIAVDMAPDLDQYAAPGVRVVHALAADLGPLPDACADRVFASNLFEHLADTQELLAALREARRILRLGGRLLILQPNIRALGGAYWDFLDHHLPLTDRTLVEALALVGLAVREVRPRFLPYTTKSRLPQSAWLVRLYLRLPPVQRLLGKQAWIVAEKV